MNFQNQLGSTPMKQSHTLQVGWAQIALLHESKESRSFVYDLMPRVYCEIAISLKLYSIPLVNKRRHEHTIIDMKTRSTQAHRM